MYLGSRPQGTRSGCGCIKGIFIGCAAFILLFIGLCLLVLIWGDFDFIGNFKDRQFNIAATSDTLHTVKAAYTWKYVNNEMERMRPTLTLQIPEREVQRALDLIDKIADEVLASPEVRAMNESEDSLEIAREIWVRIYQKVYSASYPQFESIYSGLKRIFEKEQMSRQDQLLFLVSFVQNIKYKIPKNELGFFPPLITLAERFGDCDSKALLLYILLERNGYDCVLLWSGFYSHAMLGVAANSMGEYKYHNGRRYYFLETTYPDWELGQLPPEVNNPEHWSVDDLDSRAMRSGRLR
jgi:hypothetical protein